MRDSHFENIRDNKSGKTNVKNKPILVNFFMHRSECFTNRKFAGAFESKGRAKSHTSNGYSFCFYSKRKELLLARYAMKFQVGNIKYSSRFFIFCFRWNALETSVDWLGIKTKQKNPHQMNGIYHKSLEMRGNIFHASPYGSVCYT